MSTGPLATRCWFRSLLILALALALLAGLGYWAMTRAGGFLVVDDPLQRARAIVVLNGAAPFRAMGAAELYQQGWAPEVWITTAYDRDATEAYRRMSIAYTSDAEYSRKVLMKLGVPAGAIRMLPKPIRNTDEEVRVIAGALQQVGGSGVIIVTSPPHTRRVKTLWRIEVGDQKQAIVRHDTYEPYDPRHWWRHTTEGDDVVHELLGLLNARMGFVAQPDR